MTELAIRGPQAPNPLSLAPMTPPQAWAFAEWLAETPLLPDAYRKRPASVLWAMEYGRALNLDVVTTITSIHVIKGKPCQSADLMLSRARNAGHRVRVKPERHQCIVSIVRADDPDDETVIEWTLDDAVTAGLCEMRNNRPYARDKNGDPTPWEKFPRAMLRSRAIAEAVRTACPEVLHGAIYTAEELGAPVDEGGEPVVVAEQAGPAVPDTSWSPQSGGPRPARDFVAEAEQATDAEAVRALYREAAAAGASQDVRNRIAQVGTRLADAASAEAPSPATDADAEQSAAAGTAPTEQTPEIVDAEVVDETEPLSEWDQAMAGLRAAADARELTFDDVSKYAAESYGRPVLELTTAEIRNMTQVLERAA
ncbi:recombinase RecT [Yinghuangia aomiensis]